MDKLVVDCMTGETIEVLFTEEELKQQELENQQKLEQELVESLKPSEKEVLMAEIELNTINLLIESGVI